MVSPVVPVTGQKAKRCSPAILATGSGVPCCYPCFMFKEVEMDFIKIVPSRNGRAGSRGSSAAQCTGLLLSRLIIKDQLQEGST